jgi:hypothetical protein
MTFYLLKHNSPALYCWNIRYNELMRIANDEEKNFDYRMKALKLAIRMNARLTRCRTINRYGIHKAA